MPCKEDGTKEDNLAKRRETVETTREGKAISN
jgi:hypothetical protein